MATRKSKKEPAKRYVLKICEPTFEVVEGPLAGRRFDGSGIYREIPEKYKNRFEEVARPEAQPKKPANQGGKKKGADR